MLSTYAGFDALGTLVHVLCSYRFEAALLLCPCSGVFHEAALRWLCS